MAFRQSQDRKCGRKDDRTTLRQSKRQPYIPMYRAICDAEKPGRYGRGSEPVSMTTAREIFAARFGSKPFELDLPELFEMFLNTNLETSW